MPKSDDLFVVEKGEGTLKDYRFGKKTMAHKVLCVPLTLAA